MPDNDTESMSMRDDVSIVEIELPASGDVEMEGLAAAGEETPYEKGPVEDPEASVIQEDPVAETRPSFIEYLASPIVTLLVGLEAQTVLTAHQALLTKSPYLEQLCQSFVEDGSPRSIELPDEDYNAMGSFLEFLYTGEYFPRKVPGQRVLEHDPATPGLVDDNGDHLLRHARIYTLAEKFGMELLKKLASSKIHCINSTARGELAYARYVYAHTAPDDNAVRAPIASFWAARSHALRSEAEAEFKSLCLEHPQFGYDVLTRVLDDKLKRERNEKMHPATSGSGSGRKRSRLSASTH
ncbi:BTB/POZ fold domain containing protein [Cordyceps militaris CM01]|uniref:BTB/POZ fold domain containing protein n=2 Tax=Cordyceps militaris TaxID=73501 RepID=G3JHG7_CORMM|nr:BTB/POZ fold domain containing protein [Cordyceps militaris CM01]ATY58618.1 BTB POZ fold domain containing [Cordyceps militaris]EGX91723.1 BTB/POZ fold domain containing protein [Cordyceps militaris CM01]